MAWYEILFYPFAVVFGGMFIMRIMGKRAAGEIALIDLIVVIILANVLAQPILTNDMLDTAMVAIVLFAAHYLLSFLQLNNKWRGLVSTKPLVLIRHGNIDEKNLRKARVSIPQLMGDLRLKGYPRVQDVEFAVMEQMGKISIIPKPSVRPLTPNDIRLTPPYEGLPAVVVLDGKIIDDNLQRVGRDRKYLFQQLKMQGYDEHALKYLTLVTIDFQGQVHVDMNDDTDQGKVEGRYQNLLNQGLTELQKKPKSPEESDYEIVDDYLSPR